MLFPVNLGIRAQWCEAKMAAWWLVVALMAASWRSTDACMCMPAHPQMHYCDSDFVIKARIEKVIHLQNSLDSYIISVLKTFKATEKAEKALASKYVLIPSQDSMCGVTLKPKETYLLTGHIVHLQAHVSSCNLHEKWRDLTPRQRKGFRNLYERGCACKVRITWNTKRISSNPNTCLSGFGDCFERHGVCLHDRKGKCRWNQNQRLRRCQETIRYNGTMT